MSLRARTDLIHAIVLATALILGWPSAAAGAGQSSDENLRTILDGVFTPDQAERGRTAYETQCSSCHSEDLQGMSGPPLAGQQFIDTWREDRVSRLVDYIQTTMPQGNRGSLSDQLSIDIVTHILSLNAFPAGSEELTLDQLESIQFVGIDGPAPVPEFSLIHVVGCLEQGPDDEWILTDVSAPVRASDPEGVTDADLQAARDSLPGTGRYRLVYMDAMSPGFLPGPHIGHKLYAKGYLLINDLGEGLSLTRLEAVATSCNELI